MYTGHCDCTHRRRINQTFSCKKSNPDMKKRLPVLLEEIERVNKDANTELVEIHKLYYDQ